MGLISGLIGAFRRLFGGGVYEPGLPGGSRLYVGNLSYKVKEEELRDFFSKQGKVRTLHLIRDRITRRLKGYAFIEMSPEDASRAVALNGVDFLGRKLVVSKAKSKKEHAPQRSPRPPQAPRPEKPQGGRQGPPNRWRKNRSGPRAYGDKGDTNTPLPRYE